MFYDDFARWCEAKGMTPAQGAAAIGASDTAVRSWKTRLPSKKLLQCMPERLGVDAQTVCDAAREHLLQRPGYKPEIFTGEAADCTGRVMTRVIAEFFPELPAAWAFRTASVQHLVSDEERAAHKAKVIAAAAPEAVPILRRIYGDAT